MELLLDIALKIFTIAALIFFTELCYQGAKYLKAKREKMYE
jgi:hypothetical protein